MEPCDRQQQYAKDGDRSSSCHCSALNRLDALKSSDNIGWAEALVSGWTRISGKRAFVPGDDILIEVGGKPFFEQKPVELEACFKLGPYASQ